MVQVLHLHQINNNVTVEVTMHLNLIDFVHSVTNTNFIFRYWILLLNNGA